MVVPVPEFKHSTRQTQSADPRSRLGIADLGGGRRDHQNLQRRCCWMVSCRQSKFESYVRKILVYVNGPIASAPNWYISKGLSLLAAGVYLNEASTFNAGYNI